MITVEEIDNRDLVNLCDLYEELFEKKINLENLKRNLELISLSNNYIILGAKNEVKQLVGSVLGITCHDIGGECREFMIIENLIVKDNYRGKGIGKKLMFYIEEIAKKKNCNFTMLVSAYKRKEAHKFYESIGYYNNVVKGYKKYFNK